MYLLHICIYVSHRLNAGIMAKRVPTRKPTVSSRNGRLIAHHLESWHQELLFALRISTCACDGEGLCHCKVDECVSVHGLGALFDSTELIAMVGSLHTI